MARNGEKLKHRILMFFVIAFLFFLSIYFIYRDTYTWIPTIIPEFLGAILFGIILIFALKKNTTFKKFITVTLIVFVTAIIGFIYGSTQEIIFLTDLSPELIGSSGLGIVLSLIFKKKMTA